LTLHDQIRPVLPRIQAIRCGSAPLAAHIAHIRAPRTALEAKFSQAFCVVLALSRGRVSEAEFTDAVVAETDLQDLLAKTHIQADPSLSYPEARIEVTVAPDEPQSAAVHERSENSAIAPQAVRSHVNMDKLALPAESLRASLVEKFIGLAGVEPRDPTVDALLDKVDGLERLDHVATIAEVLPQEPQTSMHVG
jgi:hypothetical protein